MLSHFIVVGNNLGTGTPLARFLHSGYLGVDLFFVLSGFLITGILIDSKSSPNYFGTFYMRRALRIFPLYYGLLAVSWLTVIFITPEDKPLLTGHDSMAWYWLYASNIGMAVKGNWLASPTWVGLGHFWLPLVGAVRFFRVRPGLDQAIARGLAYGPIADLIWCETSTPDLDEARRFADGIHAEFPGKMLAYNCSPSFNWEKKLDAESIAKFQRELGAMGYKFQFVTLAGFHALNYSMFELAHGYSTRGMSAYAELQRAEFAAESDGYTATKHQREVGTGYFDDVAQVISGGASSTTALAGSTETAQFH